MTRCILIDSCAKCPHQDHRGGFGSPAYVPVCSYVDRRELGFTAHPSRNGMGSVAVYDGVIPDWCPLPVVPEDDA